MSKSQPKKQQTETQAKAESLETRQILKEIEKMEREFKRTQNPRKLTEMGTAYYKLGKLDMASALFTRGCALRPDDPDNYKGRAECLVIAGRGEESLEYYRMALSLAPEDEKIRTGYGHALMSLKRFEEAA